MTEPSNRSSRTTRRAADRPRRMIDETRLEPTSEPHHQQKRRPVHSCFFCQATEPYRPGLDRTWAAKPHHINEEASFHRNASSTAKSIRSSVVPAERHQAVRAAVRTHQSVGPRQPTAITSNHLVPSERSTVRSVRTPDDRTARSRTTSPGGLRSASTPALPHWAAGPTSRPANLSTPPTPDHAVTPKRSPHFVPS